MKINPSLKEYIESNIFPEYQKNDAGHNLSHIQYVINRSLNFAKELENINYDMVYTVASYHDIGHHINPKKHEIISADLLFQDEVLKNFFSDEQLLIMKEAVADHRASSNSDPRNIYGKIVSSADRNTSVDVSLQRTYQYRLKNSPSLPLDLIISEARSHLLSKFGENGYARTKMYFHDLEYLRYLEDITNLCQYEKAFTKRFLEVNHIEPLENQ